MIRQRQTDWHIAGIVQNNNWQCAYWGWAVGTAAPNPDNRYRSDLYLGKILRHDMRCVSLSDGAAALNYSCRSDVHLSLSGYHQPGGAGTFTARITICSSLIESCDRKSGNNKVRIRIILIFSPELHIEVVRNSFLAAAEVQFEYLPPRSWWGDEQFGFVSCGWWRGLTMI